MVNQNTIGRLDTEMNIGAVKFAKEKATLVKPQ